MRIKDIMSKPAVTCRPDHTLNTAARLMWEHDCGVVPVVDDRDTLVGVITDRDVCMAAYTRGSPLGEISVSSAMANKVFACQPTDSLEAAEQLMSAQQIRRLPVVDGNQHPIGLVSLNDIARYAASVRKRNGLDREVTQTLAAICQPRPQPKPDLRVDARPERAAAP